MKKKKRRRRAERREPKRPPLKYEQIDPRCRADILRAARGEDSAWPPDNYPTKHDGQRLGYQERFERGDKQMMLWAIVLDAEDGKLSPRWAIEALKRAMIRMAVGASWADVLVRETAERGNKEGANVDSIQRRAEYQYCVWDFFPDPVPWGQKGKLLDAAEEKFPFGRSLITRYHTRMQRYYNKKTGRYYNKKN
jgi:hypothetical protein